MHREPPAAQRGWIGLIVVLLGLVIVGVLASSALKSYGLGSAGERATKAGTPARTTGAGDAEAPGPGSSAATPASALDRARGVEETLKREVDQRAGDDAAAR